MDQELLSREEFNTAVQVRDHGGCVICGSYKVEVHHILERKLFSDGGYYIDNGVTLCNPHHRSAEDGHLTVEFLREVAGIKNKILPPGLSEDIIYDKWGDPIKLVKYPRTYHFPWSPNLQNDDRMLESIEGFIGEEVVMTEKMDGENTTMYNDAIHARSLDSNVHPSRYWVRGLWGGIKHDIPPQMRICGENLYAKHSIKYDDLSTYFMVFNIWMKNYCLGWDATVEWCELLGLETVPVLYRGPWQEENIKASFDSHDDSKEGYVVRITRPFHINDYNKYVGKFVREKHVRSSEHWMHDAIEVNGMRVISGRSIQEFTGEKDKAN